ncbi:MAG: G8 domain-containing protein, partial [Elainellaceae cyanobacterium]
MNMQAHQSSGMAHHDDPAKQKEHMAALDLVKHSDATHVAVKSGNWSDASTWKGGKVPGSGAKVLIGDGLDVTYNVKSDAPLKTLRVDGQLDFATKRSTKMVIDTFVVSPTGTLTIGTQRNPVAGNVDAEIWIADNGKIDRKWDPTQVSRGLISHGEVEIYGQQKTSHIKVSKDAMAGDRELVLDGAPKNWQVGDSLVLTGTEYVPDKWNPQKRQMEWQGTQDEELTIKAINGNRVTLDRPLTYDHDTPRGDLKAYVTNFSRSVTIATENADRLPANQRGHVMFMHSDDVDVRYAAFQELGRSDKSKRFDDFRTTGNETRILDGKGNTQPGAANNIRGRYAVHFHRAGADISGAPARAVGNAVWGSPGWGFVNHDSHVVMENNAAYDVFGSAFVTETGNEVGAIRNNIAIKSEGASEISKVGTRNHDVARNGVGFWFQGRLVDNENNVAAGQRQAGSVYLLRGEDQEDVLTDNLEFEETGRYQEDLLVGRPHIESFKNNEVIASGKGLEVIKANPNQGHDVRSVIDGLKAWEVRTGTHLEYTSKYTLKDLDFIGTKGARTGISFGNNAEDMVVNGARVRGFDTGLKTTKKHTFAKIDNWRYAFIDADIEGKKVNINGQDQFLSSGNLQKGRLKLDISSNTDFHFNGREDVKINGTKTDSIGSVGYWTGSDSYEVKGSGLRNRIRDGYYTDKNGTPFFTVEERVADRATGDTVQLDYVFTIDNSQKNLLQGARKLGTYSGTVQRGLAQGSLKSFVDKNSGGDRPKKTNHSDMDHGGGGGGGGGMDDMPGADAGPVPNQPKTGGGNGGNQGGNNADNADKPTPDAGPRPGGNSTPPASKVSDSPDSSNGSDPIRLEAEDMSLNGFRVERNGGVSGKEVISFAGGRGGESGRATTTFNGPAGTYDVVVGYVDENDGKATLEAK